MSQCNLLSGDVICYLDFGFLEVMQSAAGGRMKIPSVFLRKHNTLMKRLQMGLMSFVGFDSGVLTPGFSMVKKTSESQRIHVSFLVNRCAFGSKVLVGSTLTRLALSEAATLEFYDFNEFKDRIASIFDPKGKSFQVLQAQFLQGGNAFTRTTCRVQDFFFGQIAGLFDLGRGCPQTRSFHLVPVQWGFLL